MFSALFFLGLLYSVWRTFARQALVRIGGLTIIALTIPLTYQIFRMGYLAAVLPNTLIAKEVGGARWSQGLAYLFDFCQPYLLPLPLVFLAPSGLQLIKRLYRYGDHPGVVIVMVYWSGALLHAVAVLRVGSDFMHGRLLLPALFALLLPVAAIPVPAWLPPLRQLPLSVPLAVAIVSWACWCALFARVPYAGGVNAFGIADERGVYVGAAGEDHPVQIADYRAATIARRGAALREWEGGRAVLVQNTEQCPTFADEPQSFACQAVIAALPEPLPIAAWVAPDIRVVALHHVIGVTGYAAGPEVFIVDRLGLADPFASRLQLTTRGRPGHEKWLPNAWYQARFTPPDSRDDPAVRAAREALTCGELATLHEALTASLSPTRFVVNLRRSRAFTRLQIPSDPLIAQAQFCATSPAPRSSAR